MQTIRDNSQDASDDSLMESAHQWAGRQQQRSVGQSRVALLHTAQVVPRQLWLADGTRRQVEKLVAVAMNHLIQLRNAGLRPVATDHRDYRAQHRQHLSEYIRPVKQYLGNKYCYQESTQ